MGELSDEVEEDGLGSLDEDDPDEASWVHSAAPQFLVGWVGVAVWAQASQALETDEDLEADEQLEADELP